MTTETNTETTTEMTNHEILTSGATVIVADVTGRVRQEFSAEISQDRYGQTKPYNVTLTQTRTGRACQVWYTDFNRMTRVNN